MPPPARTTRLPSVLPCRSLHNQCEAAAGGGRCVSAPEKNQVGERFSPTFGSSRERLVAVRGVERCLAEFCVVWSTARLLEACAPPETKRDFVFYLKALLEHAPARDRLAVRTNTAPNPLWNYIAGMVLVDMSKDSLHTVIG